MWGVQLDAFSAQLEELRHLELELGHLPQKWNVHWDKLELPPPEQLTVSPVSKPIYAQDSLCIIDFFFLYCKGSSNYMKTTTISHFSIKGKKELESRMLSASGEVS